MDTIYCVVALAKEDGVFLDILAAKPSLEEANAFIESYRKHPDNNYIVWAVGLN